MLCKHLGLKGPEEAIRFYQELFPEEPVKSKARALLEAAFRNGAWSMSDRPVVHAASCFQSILEARCRSASAIRGQVRTTGRFEANRRAG